MTGHLVSLPRPELARPDWMDRANCRTVPTTAFFPSAGQPSVDTRRLMAEVCGPCPVAHHCLLYAVEHIDHPRRRRRAS